MRWASKILSIEQCDPHITLKKSIFSTGCVDRVARSKKLGSKRHFFDCVRMLDLVSDRNPPFSIHLSDCIRIGLMQSDFAKSDRIKSDLIIRWPKSSDFGPKSDDSAHRILKSKNGIGL